MFENLFTWDFITGFVGMVAVVSLITQLTKKLVDKVFTKTKTARLVVLYSFITVGVVIATTSDFSVDWQQMTQLIFTGFVNATLISFSAMKSYESITSKIPLLFKSGG